MLYQLSYFRNFCGQRWIRTTEVERQQIYSLPHLATLVTSQYCIAFQRTCAVDFLAGLRRSVGFSRIGIRADGGIRTHDLLITNQLL